LIFAAANYPDRCEIDDHDASSVHFCAFNLRNELVGYVRLVSADLTQSFPFQSHCNTSADGVKLPAPGRAAEISRLMLRCDYRRQRGAWLAGVTAGQSHSERNSLRCAVPVSKCFSRHMSVRSH